MNPKQEALRENDPKRRIRGLLRKQLFAVLATVGRGQPHASLVAFAASKDLGLLYFATQKSTRKYLNLAANPQASMLIDDRGNLRGDLETASALTVVGRAEDIGPEREKEFDDAFLARQPGLKDFIFSPDTARLALGVEAYYLVSRFEKVSEFRPGS